MRQAPVSQMRDLGLERQMKPLSRMRHLRARMNGGRTVPSRTDVMVIKAGSFVHSDLPALPGAQQAGSR